MRIAISMRSFEFDCAEIAATDPGDPLNDCFAEFQVDDLGETRQAVNDVSETSDTVQVTVVLRGRREELENPALGMTKLILGALQTHPTANANARKQRVIDAMGIGIEPA